MGGILRRVWMRCLTYLWMRCTPHPNLPHLQTPTPPRGAETPQQTGPGQKLPSSESSHSGLYFTAPSRNPAIDQRVEQGPPPHPRSPPKGSLSPPKRDPSAP
ncbi:RNA-binding motif protein, X chromosome-like [Oncorhynchus tshawytscha]|uniref:RNA-binding motif protein, X chromosome-like n=1 Tax=Oncorhynchus tshawytscha TaxID=74940 RepID=UPI001C3E1E81|nr:RNA-binding motif protein, X chromosome-like [Oncorhynchus tshawytscha]